MKHLKKMMGVFLILCIILTSCNKPQTETAGSAEIKEGTKVEKSNNDKKIVDRIVIGTTAENNVFNIMLQKDAFGRMNYNNLTQGDFVYVDENNEIQPFFFRTIEFSDDNKVLKFTYPDAIWHDGQPVTDEDILFTFDYMKNVRKNGALANLEKCEITGDHEVTLTFSKPDGFYFLNSGANNNLCIYPKHIWEGIEDYNEFNDPKAAIGCGPYKLVSIDKDSQTSVYEMVPENNYAGNQMIKTVVVQSYSDDSALMMAMDNGEIDAFFNYASPIDHTLIDNVANNPDINIGKSDFGGHFQMTYGMDRKPCDDISFRKAIRTGLNYDKLAEVIAGPFGKAPGAGIVTPVNKGFDATLPVLSNDLSKANKMLDEAGYIDMNGDGFRDMPDGSSLNLLITLQFSKKKEMYSRIGEVVQKSLADMQIKSHIDEESLANSEIWEANVSQGKYDLFIGYTTSGMTNWSSSFRYFVGSPRLENDKTWIWGTYRDPKFLETFWNMQQSTSNEEYAKYMMELQKMAYEECFAQALCWEEGHFPYRTDKIAGWNDYPGWGVINGRTWFDVYQK